MSRAIKYNSVSMPESVIAGQSFIISVDVTALEVLFDNVQNVMIDSNDNVILPSDGEYTSAYSGADIDEFVGKVIT